MGNLEERVSGVLCDRRLSLRVKELEVVQMRTLRWMSGVTKLDRIRNERIRGTTEVR